MNVLLVLIPLSILLALGAGIAFFWAVDHDQFDDLDTPKLLPLLDNPCPDAASSSAAAPTPLQCGSERRAHPGLGPGPGPSALSPRTRARPSTLGPRPNGTAVPESQPAP